MNIGNSIVCIINCCKNVTEPVTVNDIYGIVSTTGVTVTEAVSDLMCLRILVKDISCSLSIGLSHVKRIFLIICAIVNQSQIK